MKLRLLQPQDVPQAMGLSSAAGWNQTSADWYLLLLLAPRYCFCLEVDGRIAATATMVPYGSELAWLGMVLTDPDHRQKGLASNLVAHALSEADRLGILTVGLYATDAGRAIYERAGFAAGPVIERWMAQEVNIDLDSSFDSTGLPSALIDSTRELDRQAVGADRALMLAELCSNRPTCEVSKLGYVFSRPGRLAHYLGPGVARTPEIARRQVARILSRQPGPWAWDLFPGQAETVKLAIGFGFELSRRLVRMYRGAAPAGNSDLVHAIAGFELG